MAVFWAKIGNFYHFSKNKYFLKIIISIPGRDLGDLRLLHLHGDREAED
jgi:hypothetical protein